MDPIHYSWNEDGQQSYINKTITIPSLYKMKIQVTNQLTSRDRTNILELIRACHMYDGTYKDPYLSYAHMAIPCFFMAYNNEDMLVGCLVVHAEGQHVATISLYVHPQSRRCGIARVLYQQFCQATKQTPFHVHEFISEHAFLAQHPSLPEKWELLLSNETEYIMEYSNIYHAPKFTIDAQVRIARQEDLPNIVTLQAEVFETSTSIAEEGALTAFHSESEWLYVLEQDGNIIGSQSIEQRDRYNFSYDLAIRKDYQQRGYGTYLLHSVLQDVTLQNNLPHRLVVDSHDAEVVAFYQKNGFSIRSKIMYLIKKPIHH